VSNHGDNSIPARSQSTRRKDAHGVWDQIFWAGLANLSFLPSTVFPAGLADDGLPVGLQAISGEYNDRTTIDFARLVTREIGGFRAPPGFGD
jgi:amidase